MHPTNNITEESIRSSLTSSRYAQRILESEPYLWAELIDKIQHPFQKEQMQAYLNTFPNAVDDKDALYNALRNLRKRVMLHLAARDLSGLADLSEVMTCMTNLAEITICFSLQCHQNWFVMPERSGVAGSFPGLSPIDVVFTSKSLSTNRSSTDCHSWALAGP